MTTKGNNDMNKPSDEKLKQMIKFFEQTALPRIEKQILAEREEKENAS